MKKNKFVLKSGVMTLGAVMFLVVSALIGIKNGYEYGWLSGADYGINRVADVASQEISRQNDEIEQLSMELEEKSEKIAMQEETMMNFGSLDAKQVAPIGKTNPKNLMLTCDEKNVNGVYCSKDSKQVLSCGKVSLTKLDGTKEIVYREAVVDDCDIDEFCDEKTNKCIRREQLSL